MLVQRDPAASVSHLMQLLALAKKPNQKMAEQAVCAIRDLLTQNSLVERGRQLFLFTKNPAIVGTPKAKHSELTEDVLQQAYYEHCLREIIRDFFQVL
jgi:predicted ATPase